MACNGQMLSDFVNIIVLYCKSFKDRNFIVELLSSLATQLLVERELKIFSEKLKEDLFYFVCVSFVFFN